MHSYLLLELSSLVFLLRHPLSYSDGHVCCREKQEEEAPKTLVLLWCQLLSYFPSFFRSLLFLRFLYPSSHHDRLFHLFLFEQLIRGGFAGAGRGAGTKGFADVEGGAGAREFPGMGGGASARELAGVGGGTVAKSLFGCEGFLSSGVGEGDQSTGVSDGLKKPDRAKLECGADCGGRKDVGKGSICGLIGS